jgi:hypothetical protein
MFCPVYGGSRPFPFLRRCFTGVEGQASASISGFFDNLSLWFSLKKFNKKIVEVDRGGETGISPFFLFGMDAE